MFSLTLIPLLCFSCRHPSITAVLLLPPHSHTSKFMFCLWNNTLCCIYLSNLKSFKSSWDLLNRGQNLKHHLYLKLCWQVPCETYSKFTQMKNRSPHCTLPLNHCIPPFPVLQMQVLGFVTPLHFSYFPLIKGVQSITESKFSTCSLLSFIKSWHKGKLYNKMRSMQDCSTRSLKSS